LARRSQSPARSPEARKLLRRMGAVMSFGTLRGAALVVWKAEKAVLHWVAQRQPAVSSGSGAWTRGCWTPNSLVSLPTAACFVRVSE